MLRSRSDTSDLVIHHHHWQEALTVAWMLVIFGPHLTRQLSFWWPTSLSDVSWHFLWMLFQAVLLLFFLLGRLLKLRQKIVIIEISPHHFRSPQIMKEAVRSVATDDLEAVTAANGDWIKFRLRDGDSFELSWYSIPTSKQAAAGRLIEQYIPHTAPLTDWLERNPPAPPRLRFTIRDLLAAMTAVAVFSAILHGMPGYQRAGAFAVAFTFMPWLAGFPLTALGAVWVMFSDSPSAHKAVTAGGIMMAAGILWVPVAVFLFALFGTILGRGAL